MRPNPLECGRELLLRTSFSVLLSEGDKVW